MRLRKICKIMKTFSLSKRCIHISNFRRLLSKYYMKILKIFEYRQKRHDIISLKYQYIKYIYRKKKSVDFKSHD